MKRRGLFIADIHIGAMNYTDTYDGIMYIKALLQDLTESGYASQKLSYPVFKPLTYAYNNISTVFHCLLFFFFSTSRSSHPSR